MAVSPEEIDAFIQKVEKEIEENDAKLEKVKNFLNSQNFQPSEEVSAEAKKLLEEAERKAEFESNQRVAELRDSEPRTTVRRARGLAI